MPQGSISKPAGECPSCHKNTLVDIYWREGFGMADELMETHCSKCGYCRRADGVLVQETWKEIYLSPGKES